MKSNQPTNADILNAVEKLDERFDGLETRFDGLDADVQDLKDTMNDYATKTDQRLEKLETTVTAMKATMVTKDYLDEKLANLRGDIIGVIRKADSRVSSLIDIFAQKRMLSDKEVVTLDAQKPLASYDSV